MISKKVAHVKAARQTRKHHCHWPGCKMQVPPAKWGCLKHWRKLPFGLRQKIWRTYSIGQEETLTPSSEYVKAIKEVQDWIRKNYCSLEEIFTGKLK